MFQNEVDTFEKPHFPMSQQWIYLKIFTIYDILGGCGASGIKIDAQNWNGSRFGQIVKNHFTHTLSLTNCITRQYPLSRTDIFIIDCAVYIVIYYHATIQYLQQDSVDFTCVKIFFTICLKWLPLNINFDATFFTFFKYITLCKYLQINSL